MLRRALAFLAVLAGLWGLWEAYKWVGESLELTWPFPVNDRTLPHIHDIIGQLFEPSRRNGPLLIEVLWDAALFTAKEAFVGFILGATIGFVIGVVLVHSQLLQRGFLPYIVPAFKISAPASIVGAIIGELPASIQGGLGGATLNFNQYYPPSPPSLWATNLVATLLGITFFLAVVLAEKIVVRRAPEHYA